MYELNVYSYKLYECVCEVSSNNINTLHISSNSHVHGISVCEI